MEENSWYLYRHLKPNGEVFYIGIGSIPNFVRAYSKHNRNKHWHNIVKKYETYAVEIIEQDLSEKIAKQKEIEFIALYGRRDLGKGTLCNLTDGGEGVKGMIQSEESKKARAEKIGSSFKGEGNPFFDKKHTDETKRYISYLQKQYYTYDKGNWENVKNRKPKGKTKKLIHIDTGLIFNSIREASLYYGIHYANFKNRIRGNGIYSGNLRFLDDYTERNIISDTIIAFLEKGRVPEHNIVSV